jgi:membrane fusion protein (multidrug efflux system)
MFRHTFFVIMVAATLVACGKGPEKSAKGAGSASERPLLISPEDLVTVRSNALASGPSITGSVQPERRADLRAEVPAVVLRVLKENGDTVRRGDLLVQLDDTAIRDTLTAAEASTRAAGQAFEQAERQYQRMLTLRTSGMASMQAVEDAEIRRNNAQSDLEAARTRTVQARQQLQRTEARAPFDGIVSERKVSAGDTAQIGKELLKVIDPRSMRFEGLVSADNIGEVKIGQPVVFRVNGYAEQEFTGKITKLSPAANATTRQVEVLVEFSERSRQPKLGGLYAEGRIETSRTTGLTVPATALVKDGDKAFLWRLGSSALQKVSVVIGERDARSGDFLLKSGLAERDIVIRHPTAALKDGQKIEMAPASATNVPSATPDPAARAPVTAASDKGK